MCFAEAMPSHFGFTDSTDVYRLPGRRETICGICGFLMRNLKKDEFEGKI